MTWWQGVILGVVQGLTEFLPISSSGHLVVAQEAVGMSVPGVVVEVVLHIATLTAVTIVYGRKIWSLMRGVASGERSARRYLALLIVASVPAAFVGLLFAGWFERAFDSLLVVGINFTLTAVILWSTRRATRRGRDAEPTIAGSVGIGIAQALAILPGISRSGTTISAAIWLGVDPVRAAEYSFLLAVPAIAGAALLQLPDVAAGAVNDIGVGALSAGFAAALVSGILAIRLLVLLLLRGTFHRFAPYCLALGILTMSWAVVG